MCSKTLARQRSESNRSLLRCRNLKLEKGCALYDFVLVAKLGIMIEGQEGLNWDRWRRLCHDVEALGFTSLRRSDHFFSVMDVARARRGVDEADRDRTDGQPDDVSPTCAVGPDRGGGRHPLQRTAHPGR